MGDKEFIVQVGAVGKIQEIPPTMILAQRSANRLVFRFNNRRWGVAMLVAGIGLIASTGWFHVSRHLTLLHSAPLYLFGLLLLYSSVYSFTADQFLVINGERGSIRFHKKNLIGRVDWERSGDQFSELRVFRPTAANHRRGKNWSIMLVCRDGMNLYLGKSDFGFPNRDQAFALADHIARLTGIMLTGE